MKLYLKIGLLIFLLMIISGSTVVLNVDEEFDRESSKIYMAEGTEFYEVKVDNFSINRTIDLDGTSVDMYYNSETGNLYGTVGAVNRLHRINTTDFTIEETFDGFNHNVQDVVASSHRNEIYATSTDNTIRKLSAENMEQIEIGRAHV